jgi:uncharacterized protein YbbC (DUF1343 family)
MNMNKALTVFLILAVTVPSLMCQKAGRRIIPGAEQSDRIRALTGCVSVAVVANQTSMAGTVHLVDRLKSERVDIRVIFSPEHGFRDLADAGEKIENGTDPLTGIPVVSLYGRHNKPTADDLKGIGIVIFDIQDVGVRFYTYISTLHFVMEACAENGIKCIVLDRPNPNGFYFDGNIPDEAYRSFVCMHPVPVVHGMTVGEYALMINGEGWLKNGIRCDLAVIKCINYHHGDYYELPVKPSPNLPDQTSVYLYPSLCFFEGTAISCGRGTPFPFKVFGSPLLPDKGFSFTPESIKGAGNPPFLGVKCYGTDLSDAIRNKLVPKPSINLDWLLGAYNDYPGKDGFFNSYFDVLAGGPLLRQQIQKRLTAVEIMETWKPGLEKFSAVRKKYLLYPDFR